MAGDAHVIGNGRNFEHISWYCVCAIQCPQGPWVCLSSERALTWVPSFRACAWKASGCWQLPLQFLSVAITIGTGGPLLLYQLGAVLAAHALATRYLLSQSCTLLGICSPQSKSIASLNHWHTLIPLYSFSTLGWQHPLPFPLCPWLFLWIVDIFVGFSSSAITLPFWKVRNFFLEFYSLGRSLKQCCLGCWDQCFINVHTAACFSWSICVRSGG